MAISKEELDHFYSEVEADIYNFALRWTWNRSLAEEIVHDAFIRVWRRRDEVDPKTLRGLIYKSVQNLALNERRKMKLRETVAHLGWTMESSANGVEHDFIQKENLATLHSALESLSNDLRETLLMCQFSNMSYDEIGEALRVSPGTVGSRKNRALSLVKDFLHAAQVQEEK